MTTLSWIILSTFMMSLISWVGLVFVTIGEALLQKFLHLLVSFAAGTLIAGAFLQLIPESLAEHGLHGSIFLWVLAGFSVFLLMEQLLQWHHSHRVGPDVKAPVTYLILVADGLHNFLGGLAIGGSFLISPRVGIVTWFVAAAHEIPQEFGDFAILVHGGWEKRSALFVNFLSALTIIPGGVLAYIMAGSVNTIFLLPFAAGNFIYIAASDLIPEIKHSDSLKYDVLNFFFFVLGLLFIYGTGLLFSSPS